MNKNDNLKINIQCASAKHNRSIQKPNEDRCFFDKENGIFILLDGVTRIHNEYEKFPFQSASGEIGDIFIQEVCNFVTGNQHCSDYEYLLKDAIKYANLKIRKYRNQKSESEWGFFPSTLGIIGIVRENSLHYVCVGDCLGVLIRKNSKLLFGREWSLEALEKCSISKKERYQQYCNHPQNHLSYTVFNGDDEVISGLEYAFLDLHAEDTVIFASDGISDYIKYEKSDVLLKQHPDEIIQLSGKYDVPPYADYADDKTILKMYFSK